MCTAIRYENYFGRNLDLWCSYPTEVTLTEKNKLNNKYPILGMALTVEGYPLYFDAMNDRGLAMAGLNFPNNTVYHPEKEGNKNIASFELIPYIIGNFATVTEVKEAAKSLNITDRCFSPELETSPLHWMISDKKESIVLESVSEGLKIYDNPHDLLTNNPPFDLQCAELKKYVGLSPLPRLSDDPVYQSEGLSGVGLPGDLSSMSRFARGAFHRANSPSGLGAAHLFRLLQSVAMPRGSVITGEGTEEYTLYSCCCDLDRGIYRYNTYDSLEYICRSFSDI